VAAEEESVGYFTNENVRHRAARPGSRQSLLTPISMPIMSVDRHGVSSANFANDNMAPAAFFQRIARAGRDQLTTAL
jgi:hypothetical protein